MLVELKKNLEQFQGGGLLFSYTIKHIIDIASSDDIRNLT